MKTYYHSACAYYLENWKSNLFLQRFSKQIEICGLKISFSLWDYLKSLPEYLPDPRIIIPVTRRESSGITRPAPIPEKQLPDLPDTRKNVTRASTSSSRTQACMHFVCSLLRRASFEANIKYYIEMALSSQVTLTCSWYIPNEIALILRQ